VVNWLIQQYALLYSVQHTCTRGFLAVIRMSKQLQSVVASLLKTWL